MSKKNSKSHDTGELATEKGVETAQELPTNPAVKARKSGSELFELSKTTPQQPTLMPVSMPVKVVTHNVLEDADDSELVVRDSGQISKSVAEHLNHFYLQGPLSVPQFRLYSALQENCAQLLLGYVRVGLLEQKWERTKYVFNLSELGKQRLDEYINSVSK